MPDDVSEKNVLKPSGFCASGVFSRRPSGCALTRACRDPVSMTASSSRVPVSIQRVKKRVDSGIYLLYKPCRARAWTWAWAWAWARGRGRGRGRGHKRGCGRGRGRGRGRGCVGDGKWGVEK